MNIAGLIALASNILERIFSKHRLSHDVALPTPAEARAEAQAVFDGLSEDEKLSNRLYDKTYLGLKGDSPQVKEDFHEK